MSTMDPRVLRFFEALADDLARVAAEESTTLNNLASETDTQAMLRSVRERAKRDIALRRREILATLQRDASTGRRVRSRLYESFSPDALLEMLREHLTTLGPALAVQYRDLDSLPLADLRSLLEDLDELTGNKRS